MARTSNILLLTWILAASFFAMTNASSADAQQSFPYQPSQTQGSDAYIYGEALGVALGVRDGAAIGAQDDVAARVFNAESYFPPSQAEVCAVYEDFYAAENYVCNNSVHNADFSNGFMSGHAKGYLYGYMAGYYL